MTTNQPCPFCNLNAQERIINYTSNFILIPSKYPIIPHHYLLVSRQHFSSESEFTSDIWKDYQKATKLANRHLINVTQQPPLTFVNPPQMQSVHHFHRHYLDGVFGVHGVANALQSHLNQ